MARFLGGTGLRSCLFFVKDIILKFLGALFISATVLLASCGGGGNSGGSQVPLANCFGGVKASPTPYPQVTMLTSRGTIVVEVYPLNAPGTANNFLQYVTDGFYTNKIFHRVINGFVIQGGGFDAQLSLALNRPPIPLEVCNGLSNTRGSVAMARTSDLHSATSQFYINVADNLNLDTSSGGYAVFGRVVSGMDVVDQIKAVPTQTVTGFGSDVPVVPITIISASKTR
jgi:cyclophilin family peptidyl-prolyl cis-trans isomerase